MTMTTSLTTNHEKQPLSCMLMTTCTNFISSFLLFNK